ncbi:unnamed protein product [Protopolystoma xenopodis]|uniref:Uncharacterized protein n=1 Tax=Protopolystoma xenopodis TaxID=117903 RepID=A0A448XRP1_9PLAT|nr:unnamed protein product [Protopolystoma xenopodis]
MRAGGRLVAAVAGRRGVGVCRTGRQQTSAPGSTTARGQVERLLRVRWRREMSGLLETSSSRGSWKRGFFRGPFDCRFSHIRGSVSKATRLFWPRAPLEGLALSPILGPKSAASTGLELAQLAGLPGVESLQWRLHLLITTCLGPIVVGRSRADVFWSLFPSPASVAVSAVSTSSVTSMSSAAMLFAKLRSFCASASESASAASLPRSSSGAQNERCQATFSALGATHPFLDKAQRGHFSRHHQHNPKKSLFSSLHRSTIYPLICTLIASFLSPDYLLLSGSSLPILARSLTQEFLWPHRSDLLSSLPGIMAGVLCLYTVVRIYLCQPLSSTS